MKIDFKTQITFTQTPHLSTRFYNKCESYWSLGERKAKIVETKNKTHLFSIEHHPLSTKRKFRAIAFRLLIGTTGVIPLITLIGKIHLRRTHHFEEQANATTQLSHDQKSIKNPPAPQTPLPKKSPLPFKELQFQKTREEFFEVIKKEGTTITKLTLNQYHDITDNELKEMIACCPNLTILNINNQLITNLDAVKSLRYLEFIKIEHCQYLNQGPDFSGMTGLKTIHLIFCENITSPPKIQGCTKLNDFYIFKAAIQSPIDLSGLTKLHKVKIYIVNADTPAILNGCISLEELTIGKCGKMKNLPSLIGLSSLKKLVIEESHGFEEIPSLSDCENLKEIEINWCNGLKGEIDLSEGTKLEKIKISLCNKVKLFPKIDGCKNLKTFYIRHCPVNGLFNASKFNQIEKVLIVDCPELDTVPIFTNCDHLNAVRIEGCPKLSGALDFTGLSRLKKINIHSCPQLTQAPIFQNCSSLEEISLHWIGLNEKLNLSSQGKLKKINLSTLTNFNEPLDFTECNELEYVMLDRLPNLSKTCCFNGLTRLRGVCIDNLNSNGISMNLTGCSDLKAVYRNNSSLTILDSSEIPRDCNLSITDSYLFIPPKEFAIEEINP